MTHTTVGAGSSGTDQVLRGCPPPRARANEDILEWLVSEAMDLTGVPVGLVRTAGGSTAWIDPTIDGPQLRVAIDLLATGAAGDDGSDLFVDDVAVTAHAQREPGPVRVVAAVPLCRRDGPSLGRLVLADRRPRPVRRAALVALRALAGAAAAEIELRASHVGRLPLAGDDAPAPTPAVAAPHRPGHRTAAEVEEFLAAVLDAVAVGVVACDPTGRLTLFNPAAQRFHGLRPDPSVPPDQWARHYSLYAADTTTPLSPEEAPLRRALAGEPVSDQIIAIAPPGLPLRIVRCDGRQLRDSAGRTIGAAAVMADITGERQAQAELLASRRRLELTQELAGIATWSWDVRTGVVTWSPRVYELFDTPPGTQPTLERMVASVHPDDREEFAARYRQLLTDRRPVNFEHRIRRANGSTRWIRAWASVDVDAEGAVRVVHGSKQERTSEHRREQALIEQASVDPLTGVANRRSWDTVAPAVLAVAEDAGWDVTLVILDLDHFKAINDGLGHAAGDAVLRHAAAEWKSVLRDGDVLARLGGDEFVALLPNCSAPAGVELADRLRGRLAPPLTASAGAVTFRPGMSLQDAMADADRALYAAKRAGRNRTEFADDAGAGWPASWHIATRSSPPGPARSSPTSPGSTGLHPWTSDEAL